MKRKDSFVGVAVFLRARLLSVPKFNGQKEILTAVLISQIFLEKLPHGEWGNDQAMNSEMILAGDGDRTSAVRTVICQVRNLRVGKTVLHHVSPRTLNIHRSAMDVC